MLRATLVAGFLLCPAARADPYTIRSDDPVPRPVEPAPAKPSLLAPIPPGCYRNRFRLLGGVGPDGLTLSNGKENGTTIKPFFGPILGMGYDRLLWDRISVSIQGLTGASTGTRTYIGTAGIGFDF